MLQFLMHKILFLVGIAFLFSCTHPPAPSPGTESAVTAEADVQQRKLAFENLINRWVGKSFDEYLAKVGIPQVSQSLSTGGRVYQHYFGEPPVTLHMNGRDVPVERNCSYVIKTSRSNVIESVNWRGNSCF